jgi:hypothetical protein
MIHKRSWTPAPRTEPEFAGRWGLLSDDGRWIAVIYTSEAEARSAAAAMTRANASLGRSDNDNSSDCYSRVS